MKRKIVLYCPDRHILYDGRTPDERGVGGGITARVRMSRALARLGHEVIHVGHCPRRERIDGVEYVPLPEFSGQRADVAVLTTSGDGLDLFPAREAGIEADVTAVWVHGVDMPRGLHQLEFDVLFAVSRFIADIAVNDWGVPDDKVVVTYNGYEPANFEAAPPVARDPYRLIYFSHPSKGLEPALGVLRLLRQRDERFHLVVCGGAALWGGTNQPLAAEPGVTDLGLIGQRQLANELLRSGFSLQLQRRQEPGALAIPDAQRAGCVIIASAVGVYPELVGRKTGGLIIDGDPYMQASQERAAREIYDLSRKTEAPVTQRSLSLAQASSMDDAAKSWERLLYRLAEAQVYP